MVMVVMMRMMVVVVVSRSQLTLSIQSGTTESSGLSKVR
jgi:hypothetical protein